MIALQPLEGDRERWLPLMLEADESELIVRGYMNEGELLAIVEGGETVGIMLVLPDGSQLEIKNFAVTEEHRGRGIGSAAIEAAADRARAAGYERLTVGTADSAPATIGFYLRAGFARAGAREGFFDDYPEPVIEDGIVAHDMVMFSREL